VIKEKLESGTPHLIVDTGNFARGRSDVNLLKAEYLAKAMSLMGYDAINLGREEISLGSQQILDLRDKERLPLVSSSIYRPENKKNLLSPYVIKRIGSSSFLGFEYGGVKLAIVGLANEVTRDPMGRLVPKELGLTDPKEALTATVKKLRDHCDLVVVLSDLNLLEATRLAQQVEGIDLFFIGQGAQAKYVERVDKTIFALPAAKGDVLGDIELTLDDHNKITSHQVEWTLLDDKVADDPEAGQLVADYKVAYKKLRSPPPRPGEK
jgi:2',3'-cyclic-nucleotide 2'-phosphodiesterase (5'-nucleotidase family)